LDRKRVVRGGKKWGRREEETYAAAIVLDPEGIFSGVDG